MQLTKISFHLDNFSLDLFGTEAVQHIVPRGKTNPYANNVYSTEFTVLMENYYIHTHKKNRNYYFTVNLASMWLLSLVLLSWESRNQGMFWLLEIRGEFMTRTLQLTELLHQMLHGFA